MDNRQPVDSSTSDKIRPGSEIYQWCVHVAPFTKKWCCARWFCQTKLVHTTLPTLPMKAFWNSSGIRCQCFCSTVDWGVPFPLTFTAKNFAPDWHFLMCSILWRYVLLVMESIVLFEVFVVHMRSAKVSLADMSWLDLVGGWPTPLKKSSKPPVSMFVCDSAELTSLPGTAKFPIQDGALNPKPHAEEQSRQLLVNPLHCPQVSINHHSTRHVGIRSWLKYKKKMSCAFPRNSQPTRWCPRVISWALSKANLDYRWG